MQQMPSSEQPLARRVKTGKTLPKRPCRVILSSGLRCDGAGTVLDAQETMKRQEAGFPNAVYLCLEHAQEFYPEQFTKPPLMLDGVTAVMGGQYDGLRSKPIREYSAKFRRKWSREND